MTDTWAIVVEGQSYEVEDLTWDEVEELEDHYDRPFSELQFGRLGVQRRMAFLLMRRQNPDLKWEDLGHIQILKDVLAGTPELVGVDSN